MNIKKFLPYIIVITIFIFSSLIYFHPVLKGKQIKQSDISQFIGMSKEIVNFRAKKNKEPYWTGAAFSGMPAYQISAYYPNDFIQYIDNILRFLPRPADYLFLYFTAFFILLMALKVDWKLSIVGALSFGFSTYLIIIFGVGHNAKAHAIAYMPIVIAGILWVFQRRYLLGFIITALAMALEVHANHPQMTYYLGFMILILGFFQLLEALKNKNSLYFFKQIFIISIAIILGIGVNSTRLMAIKQYADFSTRGTSELTINPDGTKKERKQGLSNSYITEYSYGIAETFNLFIPRFTGGGTVESLDNNSHFYNLLKSKVGSIKAKEYAKQVLTYWGKQPIVEAPAYIGAIIFFLFFLGMFLVKGPLKYGLVTATVFSILMSWGKNFDTLTNFFINYVPLYNKFRAVSSIQVIAELCVPFLGILGLKELFSSKNKSEQKQKALNKAFYITGGTALFFMIFGTSLFSFEGFRDIQYNQVSGLVEALISDRKAMFFHDSVRSFILVLMAAIIVWFYINKKIKQTPLLISLGLLILFDLTSVDKRYVNEKNFDTKQNVQKPFVASRIDKEILKDKNHYRVANFTVNPMQDGRTSYFHQSIGGYDAAKLGRYQELFDFQISKNNKETFNMLNTKYFIKGEQLHVNTNANGNVWFVNEIKTVTSANQEIKALDSLKTKWQVVVNQKDYNNYLKPKGYFLGENTKDSTATIKLIKYDVTTLEYKSNTRKNQFAVFSEIYYKDGWNVYIDGKKTSYIRVDYVLRGMNIPAGKHKIVFKFEPTVIQKGNTITLISYALLLCISIGWGFYKKRTQM